MMGKRVMAGLGLAAMTLGLLAVPSATAASGTGQPTAKTVIVVPPQRIPASGFFEPPLVNGDADFAGHGPEVTTTAELRITGGAKRLVVVLFMNAQEVPGTTLARGTSQEHLIFLAPNGECILTTDLGRFDEFHYTDTDHANDLFNGSPANFVSVWNIIGDTQGNEAGTETGVSIGTNFITVTTVPC